MSDVPSLTRVHVGDLHMDEANGWQRRDRLAATVAQINAPVSDAADFVYLPGDNVDHAMVERYRIITDTLAPRRLPHRVIPDDHDAALPKANRPEVAVIAADHFIVLDIGSAGAGSPDFRLTMHRRNRLIEERARASCRVTLDARLHRIPARISTGRDVVEILVHAETGVPRRDVPIAPGRGILDIGAWPEHGIAGTTLGLDKTGKPS